MSANPFEALAERQMPAPVKRRMAASEARMSAKQIAQQDEDAILSKRYGQLKRQQRDALMSGPHGEAVRPFLAFLRTMDLDAAPELIGMVQDAGWLDAMSMDERHTLFGIIARSVARVREKAGLDPYDDGVWGEPPKALHQIKDRMQIR